MSKITTVPRKRSTAYQIFILILTVFALAIMVLLLLPFSEATKTLLRIYDNFICVIFLVDFFINLRAAPKKTDYLIKEHGWLDLLGSMPSLGLASWYSGILRLARLSRLARIIRLLGGKNKDALVKDVIANRGQYTALITSLMTILVLSVASVLVLQFESLSPQANIQSGWDALWYSIVTITTVGYGDRYPVTMGGRITAMFLMFMGIGIIGALASILSSILVGPAPAPEEKEQPLPTTAALEQELAAIKSELAVMHQLLEKIAKDKEY